MKIMDLDGTEIIRRSIGEGVWIDRDDRQIPVADMEDRHIESALTSLRTWHEQEHRDLKRRELQAWINYFEQTLRERHPGAASQEASTRWRGRRVSSRVFGEE